MAVYLGVAEVAGATLLTQVDTKGVVGSLAALVGGIVLALPVYYGVTRWLIAQIGRISEKTDTRHEQNQASDRQMQETMATMAETLSHLSHIIEGQEGLMKDRALNRKRRHDAGDDILILFFEFAWAQRWMTEMGKLDGHLPYLPAPEPPRRRRDEPISHE